MIEWSAFQTTIQIAGTFCPLLWLWQKVFAIQIIILPGNWVVDGKVSHHFLSCSVIWMSGIQIPIVFLFAFINALVIDQAILFGQTTLNIIFVRFWVHIKTHNT